MKRVLLCVPVVCIFIASAAEGADWIFFAKSNMGTAYYDRAGIKKLSGDAVRVSVKYAYSPEGIREFVEAFRGLSGSGAVSYSVYVYDLDCSTNTFRPVTAESYDSAGVALKGTGLDFEKTGRPAPEHITPNSMMEQLFNSACGWKFNAF